MSSHPGAHLEDAVELAEFIRDMGYHPEQVQDFIPTPGTLSTCMYYTGLNPLTGEKVYTAKSTEEKAMQRALLQYWLPKNETLLKHFGANFYKLSKNIDFKAFKLILIYNFLII